MWLEPFYCFTYYYQDTVLDDNGAAVGRWSIYAGTRSSGSGMAGLLVLAEYWHQHFRNGIELTASEARFARTAAWFAGTMWRYIDTVHALRKMR